jgi:hypothetical protein
MLAVKQCVPLEGWSRPEKFKHSDMQMDAHEYSELCMYLPPLI